MVSAKALVIREGEEFEIDAEQIVPGDLVIVESGMKAPADLRLLSAHALQVDESLLTGESIPVEKQPDAVVPTNAPLGDRINMVFAGAVITRGRAKGVVIATGERTQLGRIAAAVGGPDLTKPPLLIRMDRFAKRIALVMVGAVGILAIASLARGTPIRDVFFMAVALAVSAIPEGLPVALTVALAIGARRMSRRNVIARRLAAVESLGSCTYIASDKTGTLTVNELTVRQVQFAGEETWQVTGEGTIPEGEILVPPATDSPAAWKLIERIASAAALCNNGSLAKRHGDWVAHGDAVDVALLVMAHKFGITQASAEARCPRLDEIPFEPERRFAASLNRCSDNAVAFVKGAAERVLPMCSRMAMLQGDAPIDLRQLEAHAAALASDGHRVIAVAAGPVDLREPHDFSVDHLFQLTFLGFIAMMDPLRPEAADSVHACREAGIDVAMVTGDHPITALAISRELGLARGDAEVVTGSRLQVAAEQGPEQLDELVRSAHVFARIEPQQKLEIVRSLIRNGHFVAVTGDGANDAPALHAAHIGVAMGKRGTDVARETADLVLTDDNFASIAAGVEEGRIAYSNVRKVIFLVISTGAAEIFLFLLAIGAGLPLPLLPIQLLWLNVITNGIQDVALAFEPKEGGELRRPPRPPTEPIFDRLMIRRTLLSGIWIGGVTFLAFQWMISSGWQLEAARNGVLMLMVWFENIHAGNSRSETLSLFRLNPLRNPFLFVGTLAAQLLHIAALYTPGLRDVLEVRPISLREWALYLALSITLFLLMEADKSLLRKKSPARS
jgi:magnesium-transporting ATPase (P-type)